MKIFFDANVLISALVYDGNELEVISKAKNKEYEILISEHIVEEILRVMLEKFPEHSKLFTEFVELAGFEVIQKEEYLDNINRYEMVRDKHDRHVLACANITRCDYLITGDKDLLVLEKSNNIEILNAKDFIGILE